MMQFLLAFSRQGKIRLQKWYISYDEKTKKKILGDLVTTILYRESKLCNFLQWEGLKIVYRRYASMVFCCATDKNDNDLLTLEIIHRYVELLDRYFETVCELDIIFNYDKAYFILDEFILGGEVQEPSKDNVLKAVEEQDRQEEVKVTSTSRWKLKTKQKKKVHKQTGSKSK